MKDIEEIYRKYAPQVKRYVFSLCQNPDLAEDITADVFCKAIENIDSFKSGRMLTWLCAIARNTYIDHTRKKENRNLPLSHELQKQLMDERTTPESDFLKKTDRLTLYRQLQRLESEMKDVVYLRIFAELSFKEIGELLGRSENWARVSFYRSKNRLKGWMNDENGFTL